MTGALKVVNTLLFIIAASCVYIGIDNMKTAFKCKKNPLTKKERLYGWRILIIISVSFFIAGFLLIVLGYYLVTRIAGTG